MGICQSCLGRRESEPYDEDDESRAIFDPNGIDYGSFSDQQMNGQGDPIESQREIEALQRIVARTSDNMVDIFEITPQGDISPRTDSNYYAFAGQEARKMRYQSLLSKLSADEVAASPKIDWLGQEDDTLELQGTLPAVKVEAGEPLVGNFADAAAAIA